MADGKIYKDAVVKAQVMMRNNGIEPAVAVLDLPFDVFGQDVFLNGEMVSYALEKLAGQTVMAKIDYKAEDDAKVQAFAGKVAGDPVKDPSYKTFFPSGEPFCKALVFGNAVAVAVQADAAVDAEKI